MSDFAVWTVFGKSSQRNMQMYIDLKTHFLVEMPGKLSESVETGATVRRQIEMFDKSFK